MFSCLFFLFADIISYQIFRSRNVFRPADPCVPSHCPGKQPQWGGNLRSRKYHLVKTYSICYTLFTVNLTLYPIPSI